MLLMKLTRRHVYFSRLPAFFFDTLNCMTKNNRPSGNDGKILKYDAKWVTKMFRQLYSCLSTKNTLRFVSGHKLMSSPIITVLLILRD
jgi:hypothetical protein